MGRCDAYDADDRGAPDTAPVAALEALPLVAAVASVVQFLVPLLAAPDKTFANAVAVLAVDVCTGVGCVREDW